MTHQGSEFDISISKSVLGRLPRAGTSPAPTTRSNRVILLFDLRPSTSRNASVEILVRRKSQELDERLTLHQAIQNLRRFAQTARGFAAELAQLLPPNRPVGVERDWGAVGQARAPVNPLPEL